MPPSTSTSSSAAALLPAEVLLEVFGHLDSPRDLYHSSLACRSWRSSAIDSRLWERHYWRFYRAACVEEDHLSHASEYSRRMAMRDWLDELSAGSPDVADRAFAEESLVDKLANLLGPQQPNLQPSPLPSMPYFLRNVRKPARVDFHAVFITRINRDDKLLSELPSHISSTAQTLDSLLDLVEAYDDGAQDVLAALAKDQQVTTETVGSFVAAQREEEGTVAKDEEEQRADEAKSLRALDVHTRAAANSSQPLPLTCLSLQHAARHMLGHLQRREAVRDMQRLKEVWSKLDDRSAQPLRDEVVKSWIGVEEALESLTLFRLGTKSELRQYLDLLALYVSQVLRSEGSPIVATDFVDQAKHPATSTRELVTNIHHVLRSLGFGILERPLHGLYDPHNDFLHVSLWCPGQRHSHPLTALAIICAVARRLGVAATIAACPDRAVAVVIEDSPRPSDWPQDDRKREWGRFFITSEIVSEEAEEIIVEVDTTEQWLPDPDVPTAMRAVLLDAALSPLSPLIVLARVACRILNSLPREPQPPRGPSAASNDSNLGPNTPTAAAPGHGLLALRDYLLGRQSQPPSPLSAALHPATLTYLPSTRANPPPANAAAARLDAAYAATWAIRIVAPQLLGGPRAADEHIIKRFLAEEPEFFAADGAFRGDVALLVEVNGGDVNAEMAAAWHAKSEDLEEGSRDSREDEGGKESSQQQDEQQQRRPRVPLWLRRFAADSMLLDKLPSNGVGGTGGGSHGVRLAMREEELPLLDPSDEQNDRVEYRVGTVFKHVKDGYFGVIMGWDSMYRATEKQYEALHIDECPMSAWLRPFYHVINAHNETHCYIPQRHIEPYCVPADATGEDVIALLRQIVPLFNLRTVGRCFSTIRVEPWGEAATSTAAGEEGEVGRERGDGGLAPKEVGGQIRMVMNAWMRQAWPYD